MKQFSKAVALVAVTTLFATAFSTSTTTGHQDQHMTPVATSSAFQVVIVGKRMSAVEKTQYDNELLAQSDKVRSDAVGLAVK